MRPVVSRYAEYLYAALAPLALEDEAHGWPLLKYVTANAKMFNEVNELVRDDVHPGWTSVLDIDRVPDTGLEWLSQFMGVVLNPDIRSRQVRETEVQYQTRVRRYIKSAGGQKRGSPDSLKEAVRHRLTGNKTLILRERDGSAWRLGTITYATETPNPAQVLAALKANKPAGIILTHTLAVGMNYDDFKTEQDNYFSARQTYATYDTMRMRVPRPGQQYVELRGTSTDYTVAANKYTTYVMLYGNITG